MNREKMYTWDLPMHGMLPNIVMTDLEEKVIKPLINDNTIKFQPQHVDDTLFVIKRQHVRLKQNLLNNFDSNLLLTVDLFQNEVVHFLDLELSPDGISVFRKNTSTGLCTHFSSYISWTHQTAWIKGLASHVSRICSPDKLSTEINFIKKLAYWNGFPKSVVKTLQTKALIMLNPIRY